ncbi:hypothetical protein ACLKA6_016227 [Drosophila palustris]
MPSHPLRTKASPQYTEEKILLWQVSIFLMKELQAVPQILTPHKPIQFLALGTHSGTSPEDVRFLGEATINDYSQVFNLRAMLDPSAVKRNLRCIATV